MNKLTRLAVAAALALTGCGNAPNRVPTSSVSVDTTPVLDIFDSSLADEPVFELPNGAARMSNGNIVVGDYYGMAVLYFDSTGTLKSRLGRSGSGPGEFQSVAMIGQCERDAVFISDFMRGTMHVLDANARITRSFPINPDGGVAACSTDGTVAFWVGQMERMPKPDDPPLTRELWLGNSNDWEREDSLGTFELTQYGPLRRRTQVALGKDVAYVGTAVGGGVDVFTRKGKKLRTIETGLEPQAVTDETFDAALDTWVSYLIIREERTEMKEFFRKRFPKPAHAPPYTDLVVDSEDMLWVVATMPASGATLLRAFARDGSAAGSATLPREVSVYEIGKDYVLGTFEDEEGFPHVAMYRVRREP